MIQATVESSNFLGANFNKNNNFFNRFRELNFVVSLVDRR